MIVPGMTPTEAERCMLAHLRSEKVQPETHEIGSGGRREWEDMEESLSSWLEVEASGFLKRGDAQARYEFDAFAAEGLHRVLQLSGFVIADADFWRYMNVSLLRDWVAWRHGGTQADGSTVVAKVNYGCGGRRDDMASRLWFRGEIGYAPARTDAYELVRRGGTDFWTSGITRVLYPSARAVAHALIEFRFPEPGAFNGSEFRPQTMGGDNGRELYKRLRHYDAILSLASLNEGQARDLVRSIAGDLVESSPHAP